MDQSSSEKSKKNKRSRKNKISYAPPNLGKAIRLPVPDFNDPNRPPVCLEVDFPLAPINALSKLEGNAGKPIYQMSKWWARRRSSVFRSLLIAAATEAPKDLTQSDDLVWDNYYCNHQKAGSFGNLRFIDPFMGGGTTLVEAARLGFQGIGLDLNPVSWFITRNELAFTDPKILNDLFLDIEKKLRPLVQPFYATTCPRGHKGNLIDLKTGETKDVGYLAFPQQESHRYRWVGPEIIYTFWAKHGPCQRAGCGHRTPIFHSLMITEKKLTTQFITTTCLACRHTFNIELGETRLAPGERRVVLDNEPSFTETTQEFAKLIRNYSKGNLTEKQERIKRLLVIVDDEPGLKCPKCGEFSGQGVKAILENHNKKGRPSADIKKKDLGIDSRPVYMYLLMNPAWLKGNTGFEKGRELGGFAGANPDDTIQWWQQRLNNLSFIEIRGRIKLSEEELDALGKSDEVIIDDKVASNNNEEDVDRKKYGVPAELVFMDQGKIQTRKGTVPKAGHFECGSCGTQQSILESVKLSEHTAPVAVCALQCYCPQCAAEGFNYNGRYFKTPDLYDLERLANSEKEWASRNMFDLNDYWPKNPILFSHMTHVRQPLPKHGYTHWWKMFNSRQLLIHSMLLNIITNLDEERWPLFVREQVLGAFLQYLQNQSMFCHYDITRDTSTVVFSNNNFNPRQTPIENNVFGAFGRGNWISCMKACITGNTWARAPWEPILDHDGENTKSKHIPLGDAILPGSVKIYCGSSTDLSFLDGQSFDLVITDPPFGNNIYYADLADFFYVWLRIPLLKWYAALPERKLFISDRTPHAMEAIHNAVEHPDDREEWEKDILVDSKNFNIISKLMSDGLLKIKDLNPYYRPEPASDFYRKTLTISWSEAARLLKPGGVMAFTFHHSEDAPWVDVLESLFDAGYVLVATYPIRSDETKGERGAFGSRKIEYDIIHVCRKRLENPQPVAWAKMRRWVKEETSHLKEVLESSHAGNLSEADLRVILRGKALEFYSHHYGKVYTGKDQLLGVKEALLGINQLLDDLLEFGMEPIRPPGSAEPASYLFLRIFQGRSSMTRDDLHKTLRGTGFSQSDFEGLGWVRVIGTVVHAVPIVERFNYFTIPGRKRTVLKKDLDKAHFLIGAAMPGSGVNVADELNRDTLQLNLSSDDILKWYAETDIREDVRIASKLALELVGHWRAHMARASKHVQTSLFNMLEAEDL